MYTQGCANSPPQRLGIYKRLIYLLFWLILEGLGLPKTKNRSIPCKSPSTVAGCWRSLGYIDVYMHTQADVHAYDKQGFRDGRIQTDDMSSRASAGTSKINQKSDKTSLKTHPKIFQKITKTVKNQPNIC